MVLRWRVCSDCTNLATESRFCCVTASFNGDIDLLGLPIIVYNRDWKGVGLGCEYFFSFSATYSASASFIINLDGELGMNSFHAV